MLIGLDKEFCVAGGCAALVGWLASSQQTTVRLFSHVAFSRISDPTSAKRICLAALLEQGAKSWV